jgi:Domain of unknown function (DUF4282)
MEPRDFLFFDKMIMPRVITVIYWLALAGCLIGGLATMFSSSFLTGLAIIVGGAIAARLYCEIFMVLFKINESLQAIKDRQAL